MEPLGGFFKIISVTSIVVMPVLASGLKKGSTLPHSFQTCGSFLLFLNKVARNGIIIGLLLIYLHVVFLVYNMLATP
jgi:hypothetical protein